jgi:hypothetical protein
MPSAEEYREFAAKWNGIAGEAKNERLQAKLHDLARHWKEVATQAAQLETLIHKASKAPRRATGHY